MKYIENNELGLGVIIINRKTLWLLTILLPLLPISYGILMAYLMGWGGIDFTYALFHEPPCFVPLIIGLAIFGIGLIEIGILSKKKYGIPKETEVKE